MAPALIALAVVVVLLGLVAVVGAFKRKDTQDATGVLSRETVKRDRPAEITPLGTQTSGKEIERIADAERRGGGELVGAAKPQVAAYVPPDPDQIAVTRRQFFNRGIIALFGFGLSVFGMQVIAFLWPQPKGGFGSKINIGKIEDIIVKIEAGSGFYYLPEGRMWITQYPSSALGKAAAAYAGSPVLKGMEAGIVALYQKCPHLGCRVPSCATSKWFECPCHGSQYNQVGEKKGGPAPRGMDLFATEVAGESITVNTGLIIQGAPIGTNTTGQEAEGPHCVGGGSH